MSKPPYSNIYEACQMALNEFLMFAAMCENLPEADKQRIAFVAKQIDELRARMCELLIDQFRIRRL